MKNESANLVISELNQMSPAKLVEDPRVQEKFIQLYNSIHGSQSGSMVYHKEKYNFLKILENNTSLADCTALSLYGCFLDTAVSGLSLEQGSKPHVYITSRSFNVGTKNNAVWEKRANLLVSPYGELVQRMRAGHIRYTDNPVIVYEGDTFQPMVDENGKKRVKYQALTTRKIGAKIIGAFIIITRMDGSTDCQWLLEDDIDRLRKYSEKQNTKKDRDGNIVSKDANALYTSRNNGIDPGFLEAKVIKHAFDTYPKVRTGNFTILASEQVPDQSIDYGINTDSFDQPTPEEKIVPPVTTVNDEDDVF